MTTPMPELPVVAYYYSRNNGKSWHLTEKDPTDLMPDSDGIVTPLCKVPDAIAAIEASKRQPQWLPIADAPKGGTEYWATDGTNYFTESLPPKYRPGQWRWFEKEQRWGGSMSTYKATHFMPLPLPPTATPQGKI